MLIRRSVFERVGVLDERLFIDYVDTEWCLRCAAQGITVRIIPAASMTHSIGDKSPSLAGFQGAGSPPGSGATTASETHFN